MNKNELILSNKNDILIPCSGETAIDLATASCIQKENVAIGGDITIIQTNQYAPFITYYLNQKKNEIARFAQGVSIVHLYSKDFKALKMKIPSINEQKKIISLLEIITNKEQLLKQKYQYYQNFKKYLMQQIFAQKLRFADFTDDWKITKLGEITQINTGNKDVKDKIDDGKYPFFVRSEKVERINSYSYEGEAILIPGDGKIGEVYHYINGKFDYHQRVYKISDFKSHVNGKYIYYYLEKNFLRQALRNTAKATVDSLRMDTLTKMPIELPSLEEQIKIADALSIADDKIDLVEKDIKIIKDFKKGLLQQMFV